MIVSIPVMDNAGLDSKLSEHFGKAPSYLLYDTEKNEAKTIPNRSDHMGGTGAPPEHMAMAKVEIIVCSGLGPKALHMLEGLGIKVYVGAKGSAKDALAAWRSGALQIASEENACKSHHH